MIEKRMQTMMIKTKVIFQGRKQLIDLSRSQLADNKVGDILTYIEELGDSGIIWHHSDIPDDLWLLETNIMTNELSNATKVLPTSANPTSILVVIKYHHLHTEALLLNENQKMSHKNGFQSLL